MPRVVVRLFACSESTYAWAGMRAAQVREVRRRGGSKEAAVWNKCLLFIFVFPSLRRRQCLLTLTSGLGRPISPPDACALVAASWPLCRPPGTGRDRYSTHTPTHAEGTRHRSWSFLCCCLVVADCFLATLPWLESRFGATRGGRSSIASWQRRETYCSLVAVFVVVWPVAAGTSAGPEPRASFCCRSAAPLEVAGVPYYRTPLRWRSLRRASRKLCPG